jgi:hypothetical protein
LASVNEGEIPTPPFVCLADGTLVTPFPRGRLTREQQDAVARVRRHLAAEAVWIDATTGETRVASVSAVKI